MHKHSFKSLYANVIPCISFSNQDAPYIVANIPANKFQPRFKNIRILKNFKMDEFMFDVKFFPFSRICSFDKINDQLDKLNRSKIVCLDKRASLRKIKFAKIAGSLDERP